MKRQKVIGILGGMGPYTTVDSFRRILDLTPAKKDWEHLRIIIDNNPKIPSRSRAVLYGEASPVPMMRETVQNLERAGADFIIIPCNTSHFFYEDVQDAVHIPILHIIEETINYILRKSPDIKRIGLLATYVTVREGLYSKALDKREITTIIPSEEEQSVVSAAIEEVKIGRNGEETKERIIAIAERIIESGAECIILGCTEVSIILKDGDLPVPIIDSNQVLAERAVTLAMEGI